MNCPLCEDARPPRFIFRAHEVDLVRCKVCGLVRVDPMPTAEKALALYDAAYFKDAERGYVDYFADEAVYRAEFRRRLRVIRAAGGHGALLDVGSASGALLAEAKTLGFEPMGIEPAAEVARRAAARTGCHVFAGSLESTLLPAATYDVVTLFDVLEHLVDPLAALNRLRLTLVPGGLLAVTVPDFGGAWARLAGRHWPFVTPWEHLLYFTRRTLTRMLVAAGYRNIRFSSAGTPASLRTLGAKAPAFGSLLPRALRQGGFSLPAGTLYALAETESL